MSWVVYAANANAALAEARIALGEDRLDSRWTVWPATDQLLFKTSYWDYMDHYNGKKHSR